MKVIGLTGGIGAGKSTIAKIFETLQIPIYNSDQRAKEVYYTSEVKAQVIALLGKESFQSDGLVNTEFIAQQVFNSSALRENLNTIIHPAVKLDFEKWLQDQNSKYVIKESAILFETQLHKLAFKNILVTAPEEMRIERVKARSNMKEEEILKRMAAQWSDEKKIYLADFVIENDESKLILPQVLKIHEELLL